MTVTPFQQLTEKLSTSDMIIIDLHNSYFRATVESISGNQASIVPPSVLANQGQKVSSGSNLLNIIIKLFRTSLIRNTGFVHNCLRLSKYLTF